MDCRGASDVVTKKLLVNKAKPKYPFVLIMFSFTTILFALVFNSYFFLAGSKLPIILGSSQ